MERTRPNFLARALLYLGAKAAGVPTVAFDTMNHGMIARVFGSPTHSGKSVTSDSAMSFSAAWACMRILAETIGALPWAMYRRTPGGNAERADDHELADVLVRSPNADMTSVEFREAMTLNLCQAGNAYAWVDRTAAGAVTSLDPLESKNVAVKREEGGAVAYRVLDRGKWEPVPRERIWHVKGFGPSGIVGLSPIGAAREAMGAALAAEEFSSRFFSQGGMPSGTVTIPNWLPADQSEKARKNLQDMTTGLGNAHRFMLFEGGMKPEPWGNMPLEDMQLILFRRFSVEEICRFYRIPPHMVADLEKATFSNIEHLSQEFVMFTLMPYFTRFEASASKWLIRPDERERFFLRFNFEGLLRAASKERSEFYASALQNGWMTRNEVRAKENLNAAADLDDFTVQVNLMPVERLGVEPEPPPPAAMPDQKVFVLNAPAGRAERAAPQPAAPNVRVDAPRVELTMPRDIAAGISEALGKHVTEGQRALAAGFERTQAAVLETLAKVIHIAESSGARAERIATEQAAAIAAATEAAARSHEDSIKALRADLRKPRKGVIMGKDTPDETIYSVPVDSIH